MRRVLLILCVPLLGLLAIAYFQTRWNRGDEYPQVADAIEQGRRASFVIFTGHLQPGDSAPPWSTVAGERLKSLKELVIVPSDLESLAHEIGFGAIAPFEADVSDVELVALDVRGDAVVASYEIRAWDLNPVETAERGPLLASIALLYSHPRHQSRIAGIVDRIFSPGTIATNPLLKNLGRQKGYWWVSDFTYTATLSDYYDSLLRQKSKLAAQARKDSDPQTFISDLLRGAQELQSDTEQELLDEATWVPRTSADQKARFVSALRK